MWIWCHQRITRQNTIKNPPPKIETKRYENAYYTHIEDKTISFKVKRNDATELLNKLAELQQQKQQNQEREEYKKLIDANGEKSDFE